MDEEADEAPEAEEAEEAWEEEAEEEKEEKAPQAPSIAAAASATGKSVALSQEVAAKLTMLKGQGIKVLGPAVRALAASDRQDALALLQALAKRGGAITDPTKWILNSLARRSSAAVGTDGAADPSAKAPIAKAPIAKVPAGKAPVGKAAVAKQPLGKAPIVKAPAGKAPLAKAPIVKAPAGKAPLAKAPIAKVPAGKAPIAKAPIAKAPAGKAPIAKAAIVKAPAGAPLAKAPRRERLPPKPREGLDFEKLAVQSKVLTLNKQKIWPGEHPLDESALAALLSMDPFRAMDILEDAEERGNAQSLTDPSAFVRRAVALDEQ